MAILELLSFLKGPVSLESALQVVVKSTGALLQKNWQPIPLLIFQSKMVT